MCWSYKAGPLSSHRVSCTSSGNQALQTRETMNTVTVQAKSQADVEAFLIFPGQGKQLST